jgi:release factor glutamine methyltransferase
MNNSKVLFDEVSQKLLIKDPEEKEVVTLAVLQFVFGISRTDILLQKPVPANAHLSNETLASIIQRLNRDEPLQYVLEEAFFYGRKFLVKPGVLIPRPETELLIDTVKKHFSKDNQKTIIDIGTGSGCIAITLKLELPQCVVYATDISIEALEVARKNSRLLNAGVELMHHNILKQDLPYGMFDAIVSNPPYITEGEKSSIERNVIGFEPELALFVPDEEPLLYYKAITDKARTMLRENGFIAFEINEKFGDKVKDLLTGSGFVNVEIIRDLSGKDRIVTGRKRNQS